MVCSAVIGNQAKAGAVAGAFAPQMSRASELNAVSASLDIPLNQHNEIRERQSLSLISVDFGGGVWRQLRMEVDLTLFSPSLVG